MIRVVTTNTPFGLQRTLRFDMTALFTALLFTYLLGVWTPDFTTLPSSDRMLETLERAASGDGGNRLNQVFWVAMFMATSLYVLKTRRITAVLFILIPFMPFLLWMLSSVLWSEYPGDTLRRSLLTTFVMFSIAGVVATAPSVRDVWRGIYGAYWICAGVNLLAVVVPACYDSTGLFRGIYGSKNIMGMIAGLGILVSIGVGSLRPPIDAPWRRLLLVMMLSGFLALSFSKTSIALTLAILILVVMNGVWNRNISPRTRLLGLIVFVAVASIVAFFFILNMNSLLAQLFDRFSFTGRTAIWAFIDYEIDKRYVLGSGYGAFWGVGASSANLSSGVPFIRLLNQAHNGYLDLHVQTGIIGLGIFVLSMIHILTILISARLRSLPGSFLFWTIIYFGLFHNLLESTAWRGPAPVWIMFVTATVSLTMQRYTERRWMAYQRQQQETRAYQLA